MEEKKEKNRDLEIVCGMLLTLLAVPATIACSTWGIAALEGFLSSLVLLLWGVALMFGIGKGNS